MKYLYLLVILLTPLLYSNDLNLQKVKLQLQWKHQFEFAGFYAAKEKGYYEEYGLDVEFVEFNNSINISKEVLEGRVEYGTSYSSIVLDYLENKEIILVANFFKESPLILVTQEEIISLTQLKNKKVMGLGDSIHNITLNSMLQKFGVSSDEFIHVKNNFSIDAFVEKKVDAMSIYTTNELYQLDQKGVKYKIFNPVSYGMHYYDTNLFTSTAELRDNPERVKAMREASIRGWEYALKNKEEIAELILEKYNTQNKTKEALLFEAHQIEQIMLPQLYNIGSIDVTRLQTIADSFIQANHLKNKNPRDIRGMIYHPTTDKIVLTTLEKEFLIKHPQINIGIDKNWKPFAVYDEHGDISGFDKELLDMVNSVSGANFNLIGGDWKELLKDVKEKKLDGLSASAYHKEREAYLNFSNSYINLQKMILVSEDNKNAIKKYEDIDGKVIALQKGNSYDKKLVTKFPNSLVVYYDTMDEIHQALRDGKADLSFNVGISLYIANKAKPKDLVYSGIIDTRIYLVFSLREDLNEAVSILNKSLKHIGTKKLDELKAKWFNTPERKELNYLYIYLIVIVIIVLLTLFLIRESGSKQKNYELEKKVKDEVEKSRQKDKMIFHQNRLVAMGEMIENIAHQWRQPLNQINSAVLVIDASLHSEKIDKKVIENKLEEIESLSIYMSNTINDFRSFLNESKEKEHFVIQTVIGKALDVVKGSLEAENIAVKIKAKKNYLSYSYANELQQVLVVLLNNAKDVLISRGTFKPEITVDVYENHICISDNGGGVDKDIIDKIFDPYFTTKHKSQGTGLGLYISKLIIEESIGGKIDVQNQEKGACFTINIAMQTTL